MAGVWGDTNAGLTGERDRELLSLCRIPDPGPVMTKWKRLCVALHNKQARDRASNSVIRFVSEAMAPARYVFEPELFAARHRLGRTRSTRC
jgi:hypothetical protein